MSNGFLRFGDGEPVPVTDIKWEPRREPAADLSRFPLLTSFEGVIPLPPENAAAICRAVGLPEVADRIEVAAHPDLAELNVQMDGFYDA